MLARVTVWEGGDADALRAAADDLRSRTQGGPPEGVRSEGITMLVDPDSGKSMMIGLFATAEDVEASEPFLAAMDPPPGMGRRVDLHVYEVGVEIRM